MRLTIQALNDQGKKAIQKHIIERSQLSKWNPQKILYNKFFSERVVSDQPYVLEVSIKNPALSGAIKFKDLKAQIEEAMLKNGAYPEDYIINEVLK